MFVDKLTYRVAIANLVAQIVIIVTGGLVRLTGSGLGCSDWPYCEPGQFTPKFHEATSYHPFIEFGNRTLTGVLIIIAVALVVAVYRRDPVKNRPAMKKLSWWPLIGIILQAVIGGMSVIFDLHPAFVGSHMLISLALVAISAYILWRLPRPDSSPLPVIPSAKALAVVLAVDATLLVTMGTVVTGAGPHSGDSDAPYRWAMDTVAVTRIHSLLAWSILAITLFGIFATARERNYEPTPARDKAVTMWQLLFGALLLEGAIGYSQHFLGLPIVLVALHLLGASLITTAATFACCSLFSRTGATDRGTGN
ncbi:MAG: COX15/CtaA family protein [Flaviflexus sp.]|nr:COX15/CtaA family protein [Flaviflexus sp.]